MIEVLSPSPEVEQIPQTHSEEELIVSGWRRITNIASQGHLSDRDFIMFMDPESGTDNWEDSDERLIADADDALVVEILSKPLWWKVKFDAWKRFRKTMHSPMLVQDRYVSGTIEEWEKPRTQDPDLVSEVKSSFDPENEFAASPSLRRDRKLNLDELNNFMAMREGRDLFERQRGRIDLVAPERPLMPDDVRRYKEEGGDPAVFKQWEEDILLDSQSGLTGLSALYGKEHNNPKTRMLLALMQKHIMTQPGGLDEGRALYNKIVKMTKYRIKHREDHPDLQEYIELAESSKWYEILIGTPQIDEEYVEELV